MNIEDIQSNIKNEFKKALLKLGLEDETFEIVLEKPKDKTHGDFSTNTALRASKLLKKTPIQLASELVEFFDIEKANVTKLEVAGPGFINLFLKNDSYYNVIDLINKVGSEYGKSNFGNNKKILLEYVSANPTGFLHIGHARGGAYGDSLARILKKSGFDVYREFYINDAGNQINNLALSILERYKEKLGQTFEMPENGYFGPEIIKIADDLILEKGKDLTDNDLAVIKDYGLKYLKNELQNHLNNYGIVFDNWYSEQSLYDKNMVDKVYQDLIESGYTYESEGAVFAKTSMFGDEKDRVLMTSDKRYTYLVPDIAYHKDKFDRGFTELVDVLGADHHGYLDRLRATMSMLGYDSNKISFEILQMVKVFQNGEEVKMSKRSGKAIGLEDLVTEVGVDPIRYFFAARNLSSPMDLDLDLALRSTNENPVYYAQYAHARICSVLRTASENNIDFSNEVEYVHFNEKVNEVLTILSDYTNTINIAAQKRLPHVIANYIQKLATAFHSLYNSQKFLTDNLDETIENMRLVNAIRIVISDALNLIGVSAPEKM